VINVLHIKEPTRHSLAGGDSNRVPPCSAPVTQTYLLTEEC